MAKQITEAEMIKIVSDGVKGCKMLTIDTATEPAMRKTDNPYFGRVKKLQTVNAAIGYDYDGGINRRAEREGKPEREAGERSWGNVLEGNLFVENKGSLYMRLSVNKPTNIRYILDNGQEIQKESLAPWLKTSKPSAVQSDLENPIIVRDFRVDHIQAMRFNGESYVIHHGVTPVVLVKPESEKMEDERMPVTE